jgi:hypothetical protein
MSLKVARLFAALLFWSALHLPAQNTQPAAPPASPPKSQFFAGTVAGLDDQHITVSRTLIGHPEETRTFLINTKTKLNKSALKVKLRVTVRYQHEPEGDVALEIRIHSPTRSTKPS